MSRFERFDRSRIQLMPLSERGHDLTWQHCAPLAPPETPFPHRDWPEFIGRVKNARRERRPVVLMMGAHPIKLGLSRFLIDLIERDCVTHVATSGAGIIHDFELALVGGTSENVAKWIEQGQFGLWRETGRLNELIKEAADKEEGLGEAVGRAIEEEKLPFAQLSIAAAAWRTGIPFTCHISVGSDITHSLANCSGAALGQASYTDFLVFAKTIERLEGGVFINVGSAVTGPEVYLKALSMARNVARQEGRGIRRICTAVFDLVKLPEDFRETMPAKDSALNFYRPWKTILARTVRQGGRSFYFCGDHRQTLPTFWSLLNDLKISVQETTPTLISTTESDPPMRRLILKSFQSPGDILILTAAVRDLHQAHPGRFETDVRTSADAIWSNNPHITRLQESAAGVECVTMHYPLIHQSNQTPHHFLHGYVQFLESQLGLRIPVTRFKGDVYLTKEEKEAPPPGADVGVPEHFWIIMAGGKLDFTAKWWDPASYQKVVDHFQGRITFVQCGEQGHWHKPLDGVVNMIGRTSLRDFIRLMYHADGVVCPVTFAMHLAAAVETKPHRPRCRPSVVIAGGREPPHWEAYPQHQFISTVGALPCCAEGGCWKSRCQTVGDGDQKDHRDLCERPVQVAPDLRIPKCMDMITPGDVIRRIELFFDGGVLANDKQLQPADKKTTDYEITKVNGEAREPVAPVRPPAPEPLKIGDPNHTIEDKKRDSILIKFRHGLGDAVKFTTVLKHLRHYHPEWDVDIAALLGKHSAFHGLCRHSMILDREEVSSAGYDQVFDIDWPECMTCYQGCPSTKAERCLQEVFELTPILELCSYEIHIRDNAKDLAKRYCEEICGDKKPANGRFPVVLVHYQGNTAAERKNLPADLIRRLCEVVLECGFVPVILDWDFRTPLADGKRIFNPHANLGLWGGTGTGDAEVLAALIEASTLMIGVDSGPLHVAGAVSTPTIAVWTGHHPVHYFGLSDNVTHLVPAQHTGLLRENPLHGEAFCNEHYRFETYNRIDDSLLSLLKVHLNRPDNNLVFSHDYWIRGNNAEEDVSFVKSVAEQDCFGIARLSLRRPVVIDLGANVGCFTRKMHNQLPQARLFAVESCPDKFAALNKNVGDIATIISGSGIVTPKPNGMIDRSRDLNAGPSAATVLEAVLRDHDLRWVDVLNLEDYAEETLSELTNTRLINGIGLILGVHRSEATLLNLIKDQFHGWQLDILQGGEPGRFRLSSPNPTKAINITSAS